MEKPVTRRRRRRAAAAADADNRVDTMGSNVYSAKDNQSMHKSLNGEFILYQVLLQRILDQKQKFNYNSLKLVEYFEPEEKTDQEVMTEFDTTYDPKKAIHWYTRESCVYKILNKALRTHNIDDIVPFNHLVRDLDKQLEEEHRSFVKKQRSSTIQVFRGQLISKDEVNRLKASKGQLISMNSFLSTSTNRKKALEFATSRPPPNETLTTILLEINVNLAAKFKPFADIKHLSAFAAEEEILFMFGCVFRIDDIRYDEKLKLWMGSFSVCSEQDQDMKNFLGSLNKELQGQSQLIALGTYLIQMSKFDEAQEHYEKILENELAENEVELAYCHHGLAQVNNKKGNYEAAMKNARRALDYLSKTKEHSLISLCYNDLASIHTNQGEYTTAFAYYEKALITAKNVPATTYSGLADLHYKMKNYQLAMEYLEKAMQHQISTTDMMLANTLIQKGRVYAAMGRREKASEMFEKAIQFQTKFFSADHCDLGYTYGAIGLMYMDLNDENKAYEYLNKAHQLQLQTLPHNHPDFSQTYENFGDLYMKKLDYDRALEYYQKKLENQLKTLRADHSAVIETYRTIGNVYWEKRNYKQTLVYYHKVLESELTREGSGNSSLSKTFDELMKVYSERFELHLSEADLDEALKLYLKCLDHELATKIDDDFSLIQVYEIIAKIYVTNDLLNQSLIYYNRLLACHLRRRPVDKETLDRIYKSIEGVSGKRTRFDQTTSTHREEKNLASMAQPEPIENVHPGDRHLDSGHSSFLQGLPPPTEEKSSLKVADTALEGEDSKESLEYFRRRLDNRLAKKPIDHRSLINTYQAIATIHFQRKDYPQSLIFWNRFLDCHVKKSSGSNEGIDEAYLHIAQVYLTKNYFTELSSLKPYNQSVPRTPAAPMTDYEFERDHLNRAIIYFQDLLRRRTDMLSVEQIFIVLGNLSLEFFDYTEAVNIFHRLLDIQMKRNQPADPALLQTYFTLGQIFRLVNQSNRARKYFEQALNIARQIYPPEDPRVHLIRSTLLPVF